MSNPSDSSTKIKEVGAIVSLAIAVLGPPATVITVFQQFVSTHALFAIVFTLIYELLIFIFRKAWDGFGSKVWDNLAQKLVPRSSDWIERRLQQNQTLSTQRTLSARYQKEYYEYLCKHWDELDTKGVINLTGLAPMPFDEGFVHIYLEPGRTSKGTRDLSAPAQLDSKITIWDYLADERKTFKQLMVIGPATSGKTTLLKHVMLTLATRKPSHRPWHLFHKHQYTPIPILLSLREHVDAIGIGFSLVDVFYEHLKKWKHQPPEEWVKSQLEKGRCLILFDGLDNLPEQEQRTKVIDWIEQQIENFANNRFIVTSSESSIHNSTLRNATIVKISPFQHEQARLLIEKWLMYNKIDDSPGQTKYKQNKAVKLRVRKEAEKILRILNSDTVLRTFVSNPLLLTMITIIYCDKQGLPEDRSKIYEEICQRFLEIRKNSQQILSSKEVQKVLQELASHLMLQGSFTVSS